MSLSRRALPLLLVLPAVLVASCAGGSTTGPGGLAAAGTAYPASPSPTTSSTSSSSGVPTTATTSPGPVSAAPSPSATPSAVLLPVVPRAGAEPAVRFPVNAPAVGAGANATVSAVPDAEWAAMVGFSWTPGCPVGRASLRMVRVNFWGFDGKRSRGAVVVNAAIATQTAAAFTRLYDLGFRIRQMRPMDASWGKNPKGPGADDYAAMRADNTSAFNCRYVGGAEATKVYSRHAYGYAIDVNDFENPYVADTGTVYPDTYWLHRRSPGAGVFSSSSSSAVRAFTAQGFRWGGLWSAPDYQHFER